MESSRVTHLVEIGDLQVGTLADLAGRRRHVGLQLAQNEFEQRRFSRAVRAEQADLVAAQQGGADMADDDFFGTRMAKAFGHVGEFGTDFAAGRP
jgi:hypothetical protein